MIKPKFVFSALSCLAVTLTQAQVPSRMLSPVNGLTWYNSPGSPGHTSTGGIGQADDTNALDLNLASHGDTGLAVYSPADGWIERNIATGWTGTTYNQILLKHRNPDGSAFYCGYLHMTSVTSLRNTHGSYVPAGTLLGYIGRVGLDANHDPHLHYACYAYNGTKLISQTITLDTVLIQAASRPSVAVSGSIIINGTAVNVSPFRVARQSQFQMNLTLKNAGATSRRSRYRAILTSDYNGADFLGLVATANAGNCVDINASATSNQWFLKSSQFSTPPGTYWLQVYYDDCSTPNAMQKKVIGLPISIRLY
jgi:murein DD-endopeptidase MepM/ murein hydrolase activator NlpD